MPTHDIRLTCVPLSAERAPLSAKHSHTQEVAINKNHIILKAITNDNRVMGKPIGENEKAPPHSTSSFFRFQVTIYPQNGEFCQIYPFNPIIGSTIFM